MQLILIPPLPGQQVNSQVKFRELTVNLVENDKSKQVNLT